MHGPSRRDGLESTAGYAAGQVRSWSSGPRRRRAGARRPRLEARVIELEDVPELTRPGHDRRLRGLERRRRGGHAARSSTSRGVWDAEPVAALDPEDYYDFQVNRPHVGVGDDGQRRITWPTTRLLAGPAPPVPTATSSWCDGIEPSHALAVLLRRAARASPRRSASTTLVTARRAARRRAAHPARSRSPATVATTSWPQRRSASSRRATRARPASSACSATPPAQAGLPALSLLGRGAALRRAAAVARRRRWRCCAGSRTCSDVTVPLGDLPEEARAWERGVDELAEDDSEVADYVRVARGGPGHRRPARGERRGDRPGVRALPAPARDDEPARALRRGRPRPRPDAAASA